MDDGPGLFFARGVDRSGRSAHTQSMTDCEPNAEEVASAVQWLCDDLPAMRKIVRAENPTWTPAAVAVESIRRLG